MNINQKYFIIIKCYTIIYLVDNYTKEDSELNGDENNVKIYLEDENKTKEIGYKLGNLLTPGSVICLIGDLGAGKTTMTQSLA